VIDCSLCQLVLDSSSNLLPLQIQEDEYIELLYSSLVLLCSILFSQLVDKKFILIYYSSDDRELSVRQFMALMPAY